MSRLWLAIAGCVWVAGESPARAEPFAPLPKKPAVASAKPERVLQGSVRTLQQTAADWRVWLSSVPALQPYAAELTAFSSAATDAALSRGKRTRASIGAWRFMDGPFEWTVGERVFWVVSGKARNASVLAVFEASGTGAPVHRASLVIAEADAPVALGFDSEHPDQLLFTTCYSCPGQSGSIQLATDGQPMFVYR